MIRPTQPSAPPPLRLHAVRDGTVFATRGRTLLIGPDFERLEPRGALPAPPATGGRLPREVLWRGRGYRFAAGLLGAFATATVQPLAGEHLLVTTGRGLFVSADGGRSWVQRHALPPSSPPFGVLPCAIEHHDGRTIVGEYPQAGEPARVLESTDLGATWTARRIPGIRHVHAVQRDPYGGAMWLTTGDADAACHIGRYRDGTFHPIGGGSQAWRAVELAFTPDAVIWGMDSPYSRPQRVYVLDRDRLEAADPRAVHACDSSIFYAATLRDGDETWVALSSAAEPGVDSTAPPGRRRHGGPTASVHVTSAGSDYGTWRTVARHRRRRPLGEALGARLPLAGAYVFLAATEAGIVLNPWNTRVGHGRAIVYHPADGRVRPVDPSLEVAEIA